MDCINWSVKLTATIMSNDFLYCAWMFFRWNFLNSLTMAVVEPMIRDAGINVIWFGIYLTVLVEMAQITPPVGFNLFVLQGMTKHEMYF